MHSIPHRNAYLHRIIHRHPSQVLSDYRLLSNAHADIMIPHTDPETQAEDIINVQIILTFDSGDALTGV